MRDVIYHRNVPSEVREILKYYENISPKLADGFWFELKEAIEYAQEFPERHHFDQSGRRRSNLEKFPYHFLFRIIPSKIRITVVRHNKRSPGFGGRRK